MSEKIDQEIAEKVMGWKSYYSKYGKEWCEPDSKIPVVGIVKILANDWHPSTSISDAWQVVEKMKKNQYSFSLNYFYYNGKTQASFGHFHGELCVGDALAICKAALKAMELKSIFNQSEGKL